MMDWIINLLHGQGLALLFFSAFISSTVAPGGSEALLGVMAHTRTHPWSLLLFVATFGNTLGAVTTWYLGKWTRDRFGAHQADHPRRKLAIDRVSQWGYPILLFSWLPIVGDGFCFASGWLKQSFWFSTLLIAIGKLGRYAALIVLAQSS